MTSILVEGETCWRVRKADRMTVLVDAAGFFEHARSAMLKAERSIMIIGWDFDTRIDLVPGEPKDDAPEKLGKFLNWMAKRRDDLTILPASSSSSSASTSSVGRLESQGRGGVSSGAFGFGVRARVWLTRARRSRRRTGSRRGWGFASAQAPVEDFAWECRLIERARARRGRVTPAHALVRPRRTADDGHRCARS